MPSAPSEHYLKTRRQLLADWVFFCGFVSVSVVATVWFATRGFS